MKITNNPDDNHSRVNKNKDGARKQMPKPKKNSNSIMSKLMFWKKNDDDENELETFTSKRDKAKKKHKNKVVMWVILFLMVGGSLSSIGMSLLSRIDFSPKKEIPKTTLSSDDADNAAKQILDGKVVSVEDNPKTKKKEKETEDSINKAIDDAVKKQRDGDQATLDSLKQEYEKYKKEHDNGLDSEQADKLKKQVEDLTKANQELTDKQESNDKAAASAKADSDAARNELKTKSAEYDKQIKELKDQLASTKSQLDYTKAQLDGVYSNTQPAQ